MSKTAKALAQKLHCGSSFSHVEKS